MMDLDYARHTAGTLGEHTLIDPQMFTSITPLGIYQGVTLAKAAGALSGRRLRADLQREDELAEAEIDGE